MPTFQDSWCEKAWRWLCRKWNRHVSNPLYNRKMRRQRAERGFSCDDAANIDNWLTTVLPAIIEDFNENLHTLPPAIKAYACGADPRTFQRTPEDDVTDEQFHAWGLWWHDYLSEMARHLREANYKTCSLRNRFDDAHWTWEYEEKIMQHRVRHFRKAILMLYKVFGDLND